MNGNHSVTRAQESQNIASRDPLPDRQVNPLLECIHGSPPRASDLVPLFDIYHGLPDTYPLNFYKQILGVKVNDSDTTNDPIYKNPPLGDFRCTEEDDDKLLTFQDPFYKDLLTKDIDIGQSDREKPRGGPTITSFPRSLSNRLRPIVQAAGVTSLPNDVSQASCFAWELDNYAAQCRPSPHYKNLLVLGLPSSKENTGPCPANVWVVLLAFLIDHVKSSGFQYVIALYEDEQDEALDRCEAFFRMTRVPALKRVIGDLSKCSGLLALQRLREKQNASASSSSEEDSKAQRCFVHWPTRSSLEAASPARGLRPALTNSTKFTVRLRATTGDNGEVQCKRLTGAGRETGDPIDISGADDAPQLDILRSFRIPCEDEKESQVHDNSLLEEIVAKQKELQCLEAAIQPKVKTLYEKCKTERLEYEASRGDREEEERILRRNKVMQERKREEQRAFQAQLEQDMDAVCMICDDGEVTPDNQILFCESCNVAVHQVCYGIDYVPEGDYYCIACTKFGRVKPRDKDEGPNTTPLPIFCELCPVKQGAFVQTACVLADEEKERYPLGKWVHSVCAKWQGLKFKYKDRTDTVEDVTEFKVGYRQHNIICFLCKGARGTMNRCRHKHCDRWLHVTCARASGRCEVIHGENCSGNVGEFGWTLQCPDHSNIKQKYMPKNAVSQETLARWAKELPREPTPPPPEVVPQPFNAVGGRERDVLLKDDAYETLLLRELTIKKSFGFRCEVCYEIENDGRNLLRCQRCHSVCCLSCEIGMDVKPSSYTCISCKFMEKSEKPSEPPRCFACVQPRGILREGMVRAGKGSSYTGPKLWVHSLCAYWSPQMENRFTKVNCTRAVRSDGRLLEQEREPCLLCGHKDGLRLRCDHPECSAGSMKGFNQPVFHVTCAREAGLEVDVREEKGKDVFYIRCYRHSSNNHNLRAKLEDLLEIEMSRSGVRLQRYAAPMKFAHAQRLLNASIYIMRDIGWAWRWAEWWVDHNSTWEPLLEKGQKEENMTDAELKKVPSTRESRCSDARHCRLMALGAALQQREYDEGDKFDRDALDRALASLLETTSLVGPLKKPEKDFLIDWLGRAYRSKSQRLRFGVDRIVPFSGHGCVDVDGVEKFSVPTTAVPGKGEDPEEESDDFLRSRDSNPSSFQAPRKSKRGRSKNSEALEVEKASDRRENGPAPSSRTKRKRKAEEIAESPGRSSRRTSRRQEDSNDAAEEEETKPSRMQKVAVPKRGRGRPRATSISAREQQVSRSPKKRRSGSRSMSQLHIEMKAVSPRQDRRARKPVARYAPNGKPRGRMKTPAVPDSIASRFDKSAFNKLYPPTEFMSDSS